MQTPFPAATSSRLAEGVVVQPRRFEHRELDAIPQYWLADNAILTHVENAFSILIPPGERFFIRSVKNFEEKIEDPELRDLVRAFVQQEGLHMRAHNELNNSFKRFGVDVDREVDYAEGVFANLEKRLPHKVQLGMTVFLEHVTATGAHTLFSNPLVAKSMHPEMLRFWRWHAVEELEHKAVAFDVFREVGGGYMLRVMSAITAVVLLLPHFLKVARRMMRNDPKKIGDDTRRGARDFQRRVGLPQLRLILDYFRPGFHPRDYDDRSYITGWYESLETA